MKWVWKRKLQGLVMEVLEREGEEEIERGEWKWGRRRGHRSKTLDHDLSSNTTDCGVHHRPPMVLAALKVWNFFFDHFFSADTPRIVSGNNLPLVNLKKLTLANFTDGPCRLPNYSNCPAGFFFFVFFWYKDIKIQILALPPKERFFKVSILTIAFICELDWKGCRWQLSQSVAPLDRVWVATHWLWTFR